jgi:hypothetical protein
VDGALHAHGEANQKSSTQEALKVWYSSQYNPSHDALVKNKTFGVILSNTPKNNDSTLKLGCIFGFFIASAFLISFRRVATSSLCTCVENTWILRVIETYIQAV